MDTLREDLRDARRPLRVPVSPLVTILMLAIGIAGIAAVFSVFSAVSFRLLPAPAAELEAGVSKGAQAPAFSYLDHLGTNDEYRRYGATSREQASCPRVRRSRVDSVSARRAV